MNQHPFPLSKKFTMQSKLRVIPPSMTICWWPQTIITCHIGSKPPPSLDYLSHTLPIDESIMEAMLLDEMPWEDYHHRSSFLPPCHMVENHFASTVSSDIVLNPQSPILTRSVDSEINLCNITKNMPVDISVKPGVLENISIGENSSYEEFNTYTTLFKEFRDVFAWTYEEMPRIDPSIVVHEIKTYPNAKPFHQKLR